MKYDNLLKTIFHEAMPALLRLLDCAPVVEYLSVEFPPRHKLTADVVALLRDGRILHIEFQVTNDPEMTWRCYHYFGAISQRWPKADVIQVVVYLGNAPLTMEKSIDRPTCQFRFAILDIRDIPADVFLASPRDAERVLAILSTSSDPQATIREILASWKGMPENKLWENIERQRTLSRLRKCEILSVEEVKQMPFEYDITDTELFKLGEERGEQRAETRWRNNEAVRILTRLLVRRFGPLPQSVIERLTAASNAQLDLWTDQVADARGLPELFD